MSCNRFRFPVAIAALALLAACQRQVKRPAVEPIAILRFENLSADSSSDWMGRAFSEILSTELQGSSGLYDISAGRLHTIQAGLGTRPAAAPGISAERPAALAAGATRIGYGQYIVRNGTVQAQLNVEDTLTGKVTTYGPVAAPASDIVAAASALAKQISPRIAPYGTQSAQAVQAHVEALEGGETPETAAKLEKAIATDPNFGPAYQQLAQYKIQQKDLPGAMAVLNAALARGNAIGDVERARIELQSAILRNDLPARVQALNALAKADPNDPQTWHDLALIAMATHHYPEAVNGYRRAAALQPGDPDTWNTLGYAAAYAGDIDTAVDALKKYQALVPGSPNPLDSMGDVHFIVGRFADAENFYKQGAKANPAFFAGLDFQKGALAHLMTGDVQGADAVAQMYFESRAAAKDPLLESRKAEWAWLSGRRKEACQQMQKIADAAAAGAATSPAAREVASRGYGELSLWQLMLGNRDAAAQLVPKAIALVTPGSANEAALAHFLSQPPAPAAEWEKRAAQLAPNAAQSGIRDVALAYALLLSKEYAAAVPVLQRIYDTGNQGAGEGLPVLLAWADIETGRIDEAAKLLQPNYPLSDSGVAWTTSFYFPRIYYLRGVVAQKQGKSDEAQKNFRLFQQLSGPDALLWGEERQTH